MTFTTPPAPLPIPVRLPSFVGLPTTALPRGLRFERLPGFVGLPARKEG